MIVVTGAAGFIGSCFARKLNLEGHKDLVLVDDFSKKEKWPNLENIEYSHKVDREIFPHWIKSQTKFVQAIIHLGARTDTAEFDVELLNRLNTEYSKKLWSFCTKEGIPFLYASSAATYGLGENGFVDDESKMRDLLPLNPYGHSKLDFDLWALEQERKPGFWAGFKFFNVYGPNEYHKNRMASVVLHAFNQIKENNALKLFKSHHSDYKDGEQKRDFIYIKDVVDVLYFFLEKRHLPGIYNLGTGNAETFNTLGNSVFEALNEPNKLSYIPTPADIRDKYQYFTEANMNKLRSAGYNATFYTLKEGVKDYVCNYLSQNAYF